MRYDEIIQEIEKVIKDENLSFITILERVRDVLDSYAISRNEYEKVLECYDGYSFVDFLSHYMKVKNIDSKGLGAMFINDVFGILNYSSDFDDDYLDNMYYNTAIQRVSSNDIVLNSTDIVKGNEFFDRSVTYCAYYMAKVFMSDDFYFGDYTEQEVYDYYTSSYAFGGLARGNEVISRDTILNFISSFKSITKEGFNGKLSKEQYIQILGDNDSSFKETVVGKEVNYKGMPNDGILLMGVDNNVPQVYLGMAMKNAGIKGVFSKSINKSLFKLFNGSIYKHSMNNGQKHLVASIITDEALNKLKLEVSVMLDGLSSGYEEGTTRGSRQFMYQYNTYIVVKQYEVFFEHNNMVVFFFLVYIYNIIGDYVKVFDKLDRYLVDNEYKVTIKGEIIHIVNYLEIVDFSSDKVIVKYRGGVTNIKGKNLVVSRMMDDELVIIGKLDCIEYK